MRIRDWSSDVCSSDLILLLDPEDVESLAAGDLDHRRVIFFDDIGDRAQFGGIGEPAPHARDDRVSAVLLDVGVQALVDEAALLVIDIVAGQRAEKIIIERRAARRTTVGGSPVPRSEEHTSELQSLMRKSYAVFCLKTKK